MSGKKKALKRYTADSLEKALSLAAEGIHVFPLGLRPLHRTEHGWKMEKVYYRGLKWGTEATTDRKQIKKLWKAHPDSVVGVATGPSGISIIDRDDLSVDIGEVSDAFAYDTARGGRHHWYRTPEGIEVRSGELTTTDGQTIESTDIKAWGGMVVYYGPILSPGALDGLQLLPERWRVERGTTSSRADSGDVDLDEWLDGRPEGEPSDTLLDFVEAIPTDGIDNTEAIRYLGPLVRASWDSPGGGQAVRDGIDRYVGPHGHKARRDAVRAVRNAIADEDAHRDARRLTYTFDLAPKPRKQKPGKKAKKSAPRDHDEYDPRLAIGETHHPTAPLGVAADILAQNVLPPVIFWRGSWYLYDRNHWRTSAAEDIENLLYDALADAYWMEPTKDGQPKAKPWQPSSSRVREVLRAIQSQRTLSRDVEAPAWLDDSGRADYLVPARDCLIDPRTGTTHPRSQRFFSTGFVDADVAVKHDEPTEWLAFLDKLWGQDDPESIRLLQEWLGYLVAGDTRRHKGMLMIGPRRSGKGTILHIAEALVGGAQGAFAATMSSFSEPFGLEQAEGRSLLTIGDLRGSGREAASAAQKLLEIIGGDSVYVNRKGRQAVSLVLRTRVMVATNSMPKLYDDAGVIESRFLVLRMTRSFAGEEDFDLLDRILPELGGIVQWALEGYRRLEARGDFTRPASDEADRAELRANSAPIMEFIDDACIVTDDPGEGRVEVWTAYQAWCNVTGAAPMEKAQFGSAMAGAGHPAYRPRVDGQRGPWRYRGIALRDAMTAEAKAKALWGQPGDDFVTTKS